MSAQKHLDPRAQAAVQHLRAYPGDWAGAIRPKLLTAALPPRSTKRGWCDFVAHALLEEIISAHRPKKNGELFFKGPMYQLKRLDLARQLCTSPDQISSALAWLVALGVVGRGERTLIDEDGQPCGKEVFAYPIMPVLQEFLDQYRKTGKTPDPFYVTPRRAGLIPAKTQVDSLEEAGSPPRREGDSLNCAQAQQNDAESVGEASAKQPQRLVVDDRLRLAEAGGGGAADDKKAHVPPSPAAASPPSAESTRSVTAPQAALLPPACAHRSTPPSSGGRSHAAASPLWTPPPPPASIKVEDANGLTAWEKATRFCALWAQAIMRLGWITTCTPTLNDQKAAHTFFVDTPQAGTFWAVAVAISAWGLTQERKKDGWDKLYHVRDSLDLRSFLPSLASGKLESEVGRFVTINIWADLRQCLTADELLYYGWPAAKVPVKALKTDEVWENSEQAPNYYRDRKLPLPREVMEAEECRRLLANKGQKPQPPITP